jgi:ribosomal protein S6--L-glutamate ligase
MKKLNFLVLASGSNTKLINAIVKAGHSYVLYDPEDLYLFVSEIENGFDRLYFGSENLETPERVYMKNFDAVISRIGKSLSHGSAILRHLTENLGLISCQAPDGLLTASDKLKTTQKLSFHGLRVPRTIYAKKPIHIDFLLKKVGGLPAVAKLLQGSQGVGVSILETPLATNTTLESFWKSNIDVKIQSFIDAGGKDIRAIVIGNKVSVAMERTANKGDFRANISKSGSGKKIELSNEDKELCIKASKAVGLEFSGVDLMKDKEGKSYIIEVNGNPGSKIINITGHNYFEDLIDYMSNIIQNKENTKTLSDENDSKTKMYSSETERLQAEYPNLFKF